MSNPYEDANRTKKVTALVAEIDGLSLKKLGRVLSGPDGAAFLRTFTDANWAALSRRARLKNPPSPTTQDLVIRAVAERATEDAERTAIAEEGTGI